MVTMLGLNLIAMCALVAFIAVFAMGLEDRPRVRRALPWALAVVLLAVVGRAFAQGPPVPPPPAAVEFHNLAPNAPNAPNLPGDQKELITNAALFFKTAQATCGAVSQAVDLLSKGVYLQGVKDGALWTGVAAAIAYFVLTRSTPPKPQ